MCYKAIFTLSESICLMAWVMQKRSSTPTQAMPPSGRYGHCLRDQALDVCNTHHAVENTNFRATSLETLRQMVAANAGVTLMPQLAVLNNTGPVRYLPFSGKAPYRTIGLCWRTTSTRTQLLEELGVVLTAAVPQLISD